MVSLIGVGNPLSPGKVQHVPVQRFQFRGSPASENVLSHAVQTESLCVEPIEGARHEGWQRSPHLEESP